MNSRLPVLGAAVAALAAATAGASVLHSWSGSATIPDNNPSGWAQSFSASNTETVLTDVNVSLQIAGGFNGDLFAYLVHGSGYAVLLNRVGRDTGAPDGYADYGFNIVLDDQAAQVMGTNADAHVYHTLAPVYGAGGELTGTWQPDARTASPDVVLADTASRTGYLSTLNGLNPAGEWVLFIADLSPGEVSVVQGFSIEITEVPEPTAAGLLALAGLLGAWRRRRSPPSA